MSPTQVLEIPLWINRINTPGEVSQLIPDHPERIGNNVANVVIPIIENVRYLLRFSTHQSSRPKQAQPYLVYNRKCLVHSLNAIRQVPFIITMFVPSGIAHWGCTSENPCFITVQRLLGIDISLRIIPRSKCLPYAIIGNSSLTPSRIPDRLLGLEITVSVEKIPGDDSHV